MLTVNSNQTNFHLVIVLLLLAGLFIPWTAGCGGKKKAPSTADIKSDKPVPGSQSGNSSTEQNQLDYDYLIVPFRPTRSAAKIQTTGSFSKTNWLQKDVDLRLGKHLEAAKQKMAANLKGPNRQKTIDFIDRVIAGMSTDKETTDEADKKAIHQMAREIMPQNCKTADPFLNYCIALAHMRFDSPTVFKHVDAAVKGYVNTDYPAHIVILAHTLRCQFNGHAGGYRVQNVNRLAETTLYCLKYDLQLQPDDYQLLIPHVKLMINNHGDKSARDLYELVQVVQSEKEIPNYFRELILGLANNRLAWNARGGGRANRVTQQGWKDFERYQRKAIVHLKNAHRINPNFPQPACEIMDIARAGNVNESVKHWFEQSTAAQFDYMPAYNSMLFTLYPRWHGSVPEMIAFGEQCLATNRFDTAVPAFYLTTLSKVLNLIGNSAPNADAKFIGTPKIYNNIKKCCDQYIAHPNTPEKGGVSKTTMYSMMAGYASLALRREDAKYYFDKVGDNIDERYFGLTRIPQTSGVTRAGVEFFLNLKNKRQHTEFQQKVTKLAATGKQDDIEEIKKYIETTRANATNDFQRKFMSVYEKAVLASATYHRGEWVTDMFDPDMVLWSSRTFMFIRYESKNSIVVDTQEQATGYAFGLQFAIPGPKIIEYELELVDSRDPKERFDAGGRFVPGISLRGSNGQIFFVLHDLFRQRIEFAGARQPYRGVHTRTTTNNVKIQVRCDKKFVEIFANGKMVLRNRLANVGDSSSFFISSGLRRAGMGIVRYKNVRFKKWELGAPPVPRFDKDIDLDAMIQYYEKATKAEPENASHWEFLGIAHHGKSEFDKATQAFNKAMSLGQNKRYIGFYLGDIAERIGDIATARKHYLDAAKLGHFYEIDPVGFAKSQWLNPQRMATFRYSWLYAMDQANAGKSEQQIQADFKELSAGSPSWQEPWARKINNAANSALHGKFDRAIKDLNECLQSNLPEDVQKMVKEQLAAYSQQKLHQPAKPPIWYRDLKYPPFFMRFWDQIVPNDRKFEHK